VYSTKILNIVQHFQQKLALMQEKPTLYLIPLPISDGNVNSVIPLDVLKQTLNIQYYIVENAKTSRRYLKQINPTINWDEIHIFELDKHNKDDDSRQIKSILSTHSRIGLMSEAGMPCIADPGNTVVRMAQDMGILVKPLVGPSSILLALISSGLNGQNFKFNGYLSSKPEERKRDIKTLEKNMGRSTQLFIEAPYRNQAMFNDLLATLDENTYVLVASDISGENESIICRKTSWWRKNPKDLGKIPCLFGIGI
jgi:16S rRNA (cytidine1402-2'-O)-methyltransferase